MHVDNSLNSLPTFRIIPAVLSQKDLDNVQALTHTQTGIKQWYGRTTFWQENFTARLSDQTITINHAQPHPSNIPLDSLTKVFIQTIQSFGESLQNRQINLEVYLDRNEVKKDESAQSGMFWHRDRVTTNGGSEVADYSIILLLSHENTWKGGSLHLQSGGEPISRKEYKNSDAPTVLIRPRFNQAVIFKNSNTGHMVEPLEPVADTVHRDVLIMTAVLL